MVLTEGAPFLVRSQLAGETPACSFFICSSLLQGAPLFCLSAFPHSKAHLLQMHTSSRRRLCIVGSSSDPFSTPSEPASAPKKIIIKKGDIVRVDKDKYLNSVEYLAVGHPPNFKGLDYIYEDRGEILDVRKFETGEYALLSWAGIPTSPAWLPTYMLIKSEKLSYKRT